MNFRVDHLKHLILTAAIICFAACSETNDEVLVFLECDKLSEDYKVYEGEDIKCQFYYVLAEYNNQYFIELNARCADLLRPFAINQNCEDICEIFPYEPDSECAKYLEGREVKEIVIIKK